MSTLRVFCREVLPLPPFEVWLLDYENHLVAHAGTGVEWARLAEPMEPIAVDIRPMEHEAEPWHGTLEVYRGGDCGGDSFDSSAMERKATSAAAKFLRR